MKRYDLYSKRDFAKNFSPLPDEVFYLGLSYGAIAIHGYLLFRENRKTYECLVSYRMIEEAIGKSGTTVRKHHHGVNLNHDQGLAQVEQVPAVSHPAHPDVHRPVQRAVAPSAGSGHRAAESSSPIVAAVRGAGAAPGGGAAHGYPSSRARRVGSVRRAQTATQRLLVTMIREMKTEAAAEKEHLRTENQAS